MKKSQSNIQTIILLIIALILSSSGLYSQNLIPYKAIDTLQLKVKYELTFQPDSTDSHTNTETMILLIGRESSIFMSYNAFKRDSVLMNIKSEAEFQQFRQSHLRQPGLPMPRILYRIHKNYPVGATTFTDIILPDFFQYSEKHANFDWEIQHINKIYHSYNTQKATTYYGGRFWEAWFAPAVPIGDGPYKFAGLPGLIVKINDSRKHYTFSLISIEKPTAGENLKIPTDYTIIDTTREQFLKSYLDYTQNPFHAMEGLIEADPLDIEVRKRQTSRRNNPIELKAD